jgi:hypothetical protein
MNTYYISTPSVLFVRGEVYLIQLIVIIDNVSCQSILMRNKKTRVSGFSGENRHRRFQVGYFRNARCDVQRTYLHDTSLPLSLIWSLKRE